MVSPLGRKYSSYILVTARDALRSFWQEQIPGVCRSDSSPACFLVGECLSFIGHVLHEPPVTANAFLCLEPLDKKGAYTLK